MVEKNNKQVKYINSIITNSGKVDEEKRTGCSMREDGSGGELPHEAAM